MTTRTRRYNNTVVRRGRRIVAEDEIDDMKDMDMPEEKEGKGVSVSPEVTELVFESEDVAELVAAVTGKDVEVTADEDQVVFTVDGTDYTVEPEGDEEILETSRRAFRGKRSVKASTRRPMNRSTRRPATARPVSASTRRPARRPVSASSTATREPASRARRTVR